MRPRTIGLVAALVIVAGATLAGFTALVGPGSGPNSVGVADVGGPFTLTGTDGKIVTEKDLAGKPTAIFFGFTFCPEVCPTTLFELSNLMEKLGDKADDLNVVFVSVDWGRDKPKEMAQYLTAFDDHIIGLTGTEEQIVDVTKAYRVYYQRVPTDDGSYTIDHTASVFLMNADGEFVGTLAYGEPQETMLAKLERLAAG